MTGPAPAPSPELRPDEVVLAQLAGLKRASSDAAASSEGDGLAQVWAFASPGNREATGPLPRFALMLRADAYCGLLAHRAAQLGPVRARGRQAEVEVLVVTADDRTQGFTWVLGRQDAPPYAGCWMTEGVVRHPDAQP